LLFGCAADSFYVFIVTETSNLTSWAPLSEGLLALDLIDLAQDVDKCGLL
jgi:hypothetical protein